MLCSSLLILLVTIAIYVTNQNHQRYEQVDC
nr:MAG TPA: hypothetical protein [Caudoviricetes sp.]